MGTVQRIGKRIAKWTTGIAIGATIAASIGTSVLPNRGTVLLRKYLGQYLAAPYESIVDRPFAHTWYEPSEQERDGLDTAVDRALVSLDRQTPAEGQSTTTIITLQGTPYEMGYAYGVLLREEIRENVTSMLGQVYELAWPRQLDAAWDRVEPFIAQRYQDELRGIADGSGVKLRTLQHLHAVPEISEGMCSGIAVLPGASGDGASWHVRILDFATNFGMQKHPTVVIHDRRDEAGNPVGNRTITFGWAGYDWSVGGLNDQRLAIGEIGGGKADFLADERAEGEPMGVLVRRTLEESATTEEAVKTIEDATRNLRYVYVISDGENAAKVLSSYAYFRVTRTGEDLESLGPGYDPLPGFPSLVYHGANHQKHIARFEAKHDRIGIEDIIEHARTVALRKNLQIWIYRRDSNEAWIGNAVAKNSRAVDQPLLHLDLDDYVGERE